MHRAQLEEVSQSDSEPPGKVAAALIILDMRNPDPDIRRRAIDSIADRVEGKPVGRNINVNLDGQRESTADSLEKSMAAIPATIKADRKRQEAVLKAWSSC